jgi:DNA-binding IscR family transcriptional regulator
MPTSTRFVVAVHTLAAIAVSGGKPMRSEDLAYSANTSAVVIRGLLSRLSEAKLTTSQLGAGGGALLAKPPGEIKLLDVYRAVEDPELFALHRTPPCESCAVGGNILAAMQPSLDHPLVDIDSNSPEANDPANPLGAYGIKPVEIGGRSSTSVFSELVPGARVVKAFNRWRSARHPRAGRLTTLFHH